MKRHSTYLFIFALLAFEILSFIFRAGYTYAKKADISVLGPEKRSADIRLEDLKNPTRGVTPFMPSVESRRAWEKHCERIQRRTLVATGLWPMPIPTPHNAVIHGELDFEDITIAKVYFESYPGHFVTGNLYRPKNAKGKLPGIISPHGPFLQRTFRSERGQTIQE